MKQVKLHNLTNPQINYLIAKIVSEYSHHVEVDSEGFVYLEGRIYSPATSWAIAGPLIEENSLFVVHWQQIGQWEAFQQDDKSYYVDVSENSYDGMRDTTPLRAAMKLLIQIAYGNELSVPETL